MFTEGNIYTKIYLRMAYWCKIYVILLAKWLYGTLRVLQDVVAIKLQCVSITYITILLAKMNCAFYLTVMWNIFVIRANINETALSAFTKYRQNFLELHSSIKLSYSTTRKIEWKYTLWRILFKFRRKFVEHLGF